MSNDEWKRAYEYAQELFGKDQVSMKIIPNGKEERKMDMTKFAQSGSSDGEFLKAAEIKGKNVSVEITEVGEHTFPAREDQPEVTKATLKFKDKQKGLVINATNTRTLIEAYGADSSNWIGKKIGLSTKFYESFGVDGIIVQPLDVEFDDGIPF